MAYTDAYGSLYDGDPVAHWPTETVLPILVEILLNGTWTDISTFVYQRDNIVITGGNPDWGNKLTPAQCTMTLNNTDGRFTPRYTGGAYYPYLQRNCQLRVSVQSVTSITGNTYSGYRFWGEVPDWPPQWDPTGTDVYVQITADGPLRRVRRGGGTGSALTRYYQTLTGTFAPVAYWPCEEEPSTGIIGAGIDGGTDMTVTTGSPRWKAVSSFNGSRPIGILNYSTWDGLTGGFASSGDDIFNVAGNYTWVSPVSSVDCRCWGPGGNGGAAGGIGGGGGEFAKEATLAVTVGQPYTFTVPAAGSGASTVFAGDSVTVTANNGTNGGSGGTGGSGSTNTTHHSGGNGGNGSGSAGGGGGGSGGTAAAGNNGGNASGLNGGTGAAAVTGGGAGGRGADFNGSKSAQGGAPGGGGGAASPNLPKSNGAAGKVEFVYTPVSTPNNNVVRFIVLIPASGGNDGKVLLDAETGGTIKSMRVIYHAGGNLQLKGFSVANGGGTTLFDSGSISMGADGQPLMVSAELATSGANVAWTFKAIQPGATSVVNSAAGTVTTATIGNVTEVLAGPNADVSATAIGHISVQYALIDLIRVSRALNGHVSEIGVDRLIRLCNEQALDFEPGWNETVDHWGFETGIQGWGATNGTQTQSSVTVSGVFPPGELDPIRNFWAWPIDGTHSLLVTCSGAGNPQAFSPTGTSGQPILPGDRVSMALECYTPAALTGTLKAQIKFFDNAGGSLTTADGPTMSFAAGQIATLKAVGIAPTGAAFFNVHWVGSAAEPANRLIYCDNVRVHPRMGPQTRKKLHEFLEDIEQLDQGIMKESRKLHGLGFRTRISLINQTTALTLDYSQAQVAQPGLQPVSDDQKTINHVIVKRHKGSKASQTQDGGGMGTGEPPNGVGRYKKLYQVIAEDDSQLLALASHLLTLGTWDGERYPVISNDLSRTEVASLMSAIAGVDIGDFVTITNLPFWCQSSTAKQIVSGYTETLNAKIWTIQWNCQPESPFEITATSMRRW